MQLRLVALGLIFLTTSCGDNKSQLTPDAKVDASIDSPTDANAADQIAAAKATADGAGLMLPIGYAVVTYIKPAIGNLANDPAGFTIQATMMGPAMFVAVDPATTNPPLARGDTISFTITDLLTVGGQKRATGIANLTRIGTGFDVTTLSQNVTTATDLVTAIDTYDSELVDVTGTLSTTGSSGSGFEKFQLTTTGLTSPMLVVRVPSTLRDAVDMVSTCTVTLKDTPVGRFNAETQLAAFVANDLTVASCPAPTVVSAVDASTTSVNITFSRRIAPASVMANGSQFTFDNGLVATAATVNGRTVTVTTGAQAIGTTYTVTVAGTVTDLQGTGVATPSTATFLGFEQPASVKLNEVNAHINQGCDLIELRVLASGTLRGIRIQERGADIVQLPSVNVAKNDIVVLHLDSADTTNCNPGASTNETTSITQNPVVTFARNYDTAWDLFSTDTGLTDTDNVIGVIDRFGAFVDAVLIDDDMPGSNVAAASETAAATVAGANMWRMNGGGIPANGFVDDDFRTNAVVNSAAATTVSHTGANSESLRRIDDTDENEKADWLQGLNTWGLINIGQTPIL